MTWLVVVVGFLLLVLVHEAGHFFVARAVGMRPRKFYVGFPPAIAKTTRNGIEYGVGAIPLGGYVRIPGMHRPAAKDVRLALGAALQEAPELLEPLEAIARRLDAADFAAARAAAGPLAAAVEDAELSPGARKAAERGLRDLDESLGDDPYWRQRTWKRVAVIFAGPGVNMLAALALLAIVYAVGVPTGIPLRTVDAVTKGTPAAKAGLRPGDLVVAVNGVPTRTFAQMHRRIDATHGGPLRVVVLRDGRRVALRPARSIYSPDSQSWIFGFAPKQRIVYETFAAGTSIRLAADDCGQAIVGTIRAIGGIFHKRERSQLHSVYGIAQASHQALLIGVRAYLRLLGFISLALAILNLLPLLPLDGGHILFSLIEAVRRRAVAREVYERASVIGFSLLMLVFLIALNNDLAGKGG